jgi:two-component system NtrC family sensor kinase
MQHRGREMQHRGRNGQPVKGRRVNRPKAGKSSTTASSIADLQKRVATLTRELKEANERQAATAAVLQVINSSPGDLAPVFDAMLERAMRLCEASHCHIWRFDGELLHAVSVRGDSLFTEWLQEHSSVPPIPGSAAGRIVRGEDIVHVSDRRDEEAYSSNPVFRGLVDASGVRTSLSVGLRRDESLLGIINVYRQEVRPFSDKQIELLQNFAAQAVVALENARLFNETEEALQQQTATADVLKVISRSAFDIHAVLRTLVESAARLCQAETVQIFLRDGELYRPVAHNGFSPEYQRYAEENPIAPGRGTLVARTALELATVHIPDVLLDPEYTWHEGRKLGGFRAMLGVPLLREQSCIGVMAMTRLTARPFTDRQIELVRVFADQAVIAIENTRLFNEVQTKTRDLEESLQQQTATADVLKVISRSAFDLEAVLNTLVESAVRLSGGSLGTIFQRRGELFHLTAAHGYTSEMQAYGHANPLAPGPGSTVGRTAMTGTVVQIPDVMADPDYTALGYQRVGSFRAMLGIPIMREGKVEGVFSLAKPEPGPFGSRQVELVQTFADQAIIAIENVRLFDEVQARTRELTEALEQQTATAEVLSVISSSTGNLAPVFDAMLRKAMELCGANFGVLNTYDGKAFSTAAAFGLPSAYDAYRRKQPLEYGPNTAPARLLQGEPVVEITDLLESEAYRRGDPNRRALVDIGGARCLLAVPLLKDERVVGNVMIFRQENRPFSEKQITLLQQFAAQAVIAIENTRLLRELRESTEDLSESLQQQTATAEVLKAISRSTFDLPAVLHALVETASRLCEADKGTITRQKDGQFFRAESYGFSEQFMNYVRGVPVVVDRHSATGRALLEGVVVHIPDVEADPDYTFREGQRLGDFRSLLGVPMLRERIPVGVLTLTRTEPRAFSDKQIELVITFADQAAIAIENVRLFDEVQTRTLELAQSLEDLRAAKDRLVQTEKLASLGQLTAGIAHEIKNPLNFVNNFAALSAELTDELNGVLSQTSLADGIRAEVDELTTLLRGNLAKVVQHGKRADSIVKNMLLHSREGSGEHRPVDINAIVDESLNLGYHGARAEKAGFNITIKRNFDPAVGMANVYPQEVTRVLLNLISNGFYATTKRKTEVGDGFEPTLTATTKNLADKVEIRIRDNGTGIPDEVREKMFNPFFTTKPAGEGTGLGLSMSHDIIVKQHGGTIEVYTALGVYTEFRIVLPRAGATLIKSGEQG